MYVAFNINSFSVHIIYFSPHSLWSGHSSFSMYQIFNTGTINTIPLGRGVGTGPAGPATAGPMFLEPTIKNIIPSFVIKQIKNFYITAACLYYFNKGIALLYYRKNKIPIFFKQQLCYKLGACKNNSRLLRVKLNNRFSRRFLLISCHQVPRLHLKN